MDPVNKELYIDIRQTEMVMALVENKQLVELNRVHHQRGFSVGDIYLGKVRKLAPGLNAAFVDVGHEKDAFLHYLDLGPQFNSLSKFLESSLKKKQLSSFDPFILEPEIDKGGKITGVLNPGQTVLVQIAKEPIGQKGPRLSSDISIAGRNLVLVPFSDKISVSSKIRNTEEKNRLRRIFSSIKPPGYGVIIRTNAQNRSVDKLNSELRQLIDKWENAFKFLTSFEAPQILISEISRSSAVLRDLLNESFSQIVVNDPSLFQEIKKYIETIAPEKKSILKLYAGRVPLFEQFNLEKQIKTLFGKTVTFRHGAYIIIEHTEALHVIDVNSGNKAKNSSDQETNALEINLAAAEEIARQLRLRDMGGIIVIDFIDMHDPQNKARVFESMRTLMSADKARHTILPLTKFGLMQITRQRVRPETIVNTLEKCPSCKGSGVVTPSIVLTEEIENALRFLTSRDKKGAIHLSVHPMMAAYLKRGFFSQVWKWIYRFKRRIRVFEKPNFSLLEYKLESPLTQPADTEPETLE